MEALERACVGDDPRKIQSGVDELDRTTKEFAGRRMNRAIARAIGGRRVDDVGEEVEHAKGIERAHDAPDLSAAAPRGR
jgi:molecular chaperone HscA